jgi:hypothetical protein
MKICLIFLVVFLSACAAKKQAAEFEAQPAWMKQKPIIPGYYTGIGSAKKVGTSSEYIANARKDALADLAGEVAVQISSTSVYHSIENKYGQIESYDQRIETNVKDYLEGFEPVEIYENADSYWVYYSISKQVYIEKKESKKQEALMMALAKHNSGNQEDLSGKPKEALAFYLQGLQAIKPYLKEETSVASGDSQIDIGNRLFSSMDQLLSDLIINPEINELKVKRGTSFNQDLRFMVLYKNQVVRGIPVEFSYTGGYLKNDRVMTDLNGYAILQPEIIYSKNKQEQLSACINVKEMASRAVEDTFIRGLVLKKAIQPATVKVNIEPPTLSLEIIENSCEGDECESLLQIFNQSMNTSGLVFIDKGVSDFTFQLSYRLLPGTSAGGLLSTELNGRLKILDKNKNTVWTKEINGIRGVGSDSKEALEKAFSEFIIALSKNYIRQGLDKIIPTY